MRVVDIISITCIAMTEKMGIGSGISATWEESIVTVLPTKLLAENTNGTNKGWNNSVISTNIKGYPEKTPKDETKQHIATTHPGMSKSRGIINTKLRKILAAKLYLFSNTYLNETAVMHEQIVEIPTDILLINMFPPIYLV